MPEGAILLDLKRDAYLGITLEQACALSHLVEWWPTAGASTYDAALQTEADALAQNFLSRGMLERCDSGSSTCAAVTPLPMARDELIQWQHMPSQHIHAGHAATFLRAFFGTVAQLRFMSMDAIVQRHQARRTRRASDRFDLEQARLLMSAYEHIRTWAFARRGRCLLDSLTLLEFLAHYDVYPRWVIGVRARPFAAHSWLQHEHWVLNGTPALIRSFTPILVT